MVQGIFSAPVGSFNTTSGAGCAHFIVQELDGPLADLWIDDHLYAEQQLLIEAEQLEELSDDGPVVELNHILNSSCLQVVVD